MDRETESSETAVEESEKVLEWACLELPYIPDFLLDDVRFYFVPSREDIRAVYHRLVGESADNWGSYYSKKGWRFLHEGSERDGPWRVRPGGIDLEVLEPGRFFAPRPRFRFEPDGPAYPLASMEKRRPINPWKPTYLRSLEFIRKYQWPHPLPRGVQAAIWEIEECGEIAGSTSWKNAEALLLRNDSEELEKTLVDVFYNRPENYPLGSQVYLRVLGRLGDSGFRRLTELASHPVTRKRVVVATTLGELGDPRGLESLLLLLDDEDPNVRSAALRSLGRIGLAEGADPDGKVEAYLESEELPHRVWAAQALMSRDESHRKYLLQLVKEEKRPLADMGELGEVLVDSEVIDAVPFLIQRLKDERAEVSMDAAEVLQKLTGVDVDYSASGSAEQRRVAIKTYSRWWEDRKRERAAKRHGDRKNVRKK